MNLYHTFLLIASKIENKSNCLLIENNTNKSYINYFIKWQKWANQFPEVNATPAEKVYVILYMLSLFQNKKSYLSIRMSHYAIKYFKWKSDKMKDSYVYKDLESKLSVSRNLGL